MYELTYAKVFSRLLADCQAMASGSRIRGLARMPVCQEWAGNGGLNRRRRLATPFFIQTSLITVHKYARESASSRTNHYRQKRMQMSHRYSDIHRKLNCFTTQPRTRRGHGQNSAGQDFQHILSRRDGKKHQVRQGLQVLPDSDFSLCFCCGLWHANYMQTSLISGQTGPQDTHRVPDSCSLPILAVSTSSFHAYNSLAVEALLTTN